MSSKGIKKPKHVPMRTCIGSHTQHPKREMVRLVCLADGHVVVDPTGKLNGSRGAYISRHKTAVHNAIKHKRIEAEFGQALKPEDAEAILAYFKDFPD
ncbi:MAG: YlxR family protein [Anaerolineae bacterium]|nr:YlxR family protein [Anaerolineae bacterium]